MRQGRVIQGFFPAGAVRASPGSAIQPFQTPMGGARHAPGPPDPAFSRSGNSALPPRPASGRPSAPQAAYVVQRYGGDASCAVDPIQLGLAQGGGRPLSQGLLAKMEAAFDADFSTVRIHVGPQASRIGAIAFTTGNNIYFAPGRYQPDSMQGQQLIGHELAHVIQQRAGRVRAPGVGMAVVQDRALEAEADRLGMRAAMHRGPPVAAPQLQPITHRSLVQRALEAKAKEENDLVSLAKQIHSKLTDNARALAASTVAIVEYSNGVLKCATNDVNKLSKIALQLAEDLGIVDGINPAGAGFHAEMWIVLSEMHALNEVSKIGASRPCCKYCTAILNECGIAMVEPSQTLYRSWYNPLTMNEKSKPRNDFKSKQKSSIPDFRQNGKDYWFTDINGNFTNAPPK